MASFNDVVKKAVQDVSHDTLVARRYDLELRSPSTDDHDYADIPNIEKLSMFTESRLG